MRRPKAGDGYAPPVGRSVGRGRQLESSKMQTMRGAIRILGIDPGLRRTGWGVIDIAGNRLSYVACGSLATDDRADLATRLVAIHDGLIAVIEEFRPEEAAVEATFVNKDASATLKLGQARGVALL